MKIETDIRKIKKLAARYDDENWEFRAFLKASSLSSKKLDSVFHRHCQEVTAAIDCATCGNCCREALPTLSPTDIQRLATGLKLTEEQVHQRYLHPGDEPGSIEFNAKPCPFLSENKCSVHEFRPDVCRSYPHLHKPDRVFHLIGVVTNCSICPIVFNVYERVKAELWER